MVRNKLIPVIKEIKPGYIGVFEHFFNSFEEEKLFINKLSKKILKKLISFDSLTYTAINSDKYKKLNPVLQKNIVKLILKKIGYPVKPNKNMLRLLSGNKEKYSYKSGSFIAYSKSSLLWFIDKNKINSDFNFSVNRVPETIHFEELTVHFENKIKPDTNNIFSFTGEKIKFPITGISLSGNDSIFTAKEKLKSIKSILSDNKIPELLFKKALVFKDADKKIIGFIFNKFFRVSYNYYLDDLTKESITVKVTDER